MVFETKKIQIETLGEYLLEVRTSLGFSIAEVSEKTSIKAQYLQSLEAGKFNNLPADVYIYGFLKKLAQLYALEQETLISQYKKEKGISVSQAKSTEERVHSQARKWLLGIVITPRSVSISGGALFIAATLGYIIFQVISINKTPDLVIYEPQDRQVVSSSAIQVRGKTDPGTKLFINDQSVFVTSTGEFEAQVGLSNGPKDLNFVAQNKFDKSSTKTITIIGNVTGTEQQKAEVGVDLTISFSSPVTLTYTIDAVLPQTVMFKAGEEKKLTARDKIFITTSDAGSTRVVYNGQDLGALGNAGERLENVPFFKESDSIKRSTSSPQ